MSTKLGDTPSPPTAFETRSLLHFVFLHFEPTQQIQILVLVLSLSSGYAPLEANHIARPQDGARMNC